MTDEKSTEHRLSTLEEAMRLIFLNELPHLREDIADIKQWVRGIAIGGFLAILGFILKEILG